VRSDASTYDPRSADDGGEERLDQIQRGEGRDAELHGARDAAGEKRELREPAEEDHDHSGDRGETTCEQRRSATVQRAGDPCRRGIGEEISTRGAEEAREPRRPDRREHWKTSRPRSEIQRHAGGSRRRTEPHTSEDHEHRLQRDGDRSPWQRDRDLRRGGNRGGEPDDADRGRARRAECFGGRERGHADR